MCIWIGAVQKRLASNLDAVLKDLHELAAKYSPNNNRFTPERRLSDYNKYSRRRESVNCALPAAHYVTVGFISFGR